MIKKSRSIPQIPAQKTLRLPLQIELLFEKLLKISRPRFWIYLAGPYAVGYAIAADSLSDLLSFHFVIHFLYFLIPANVFLYAINDYYDQDTDALNPKKDLKEYRYMNSDARFINSTLFISLFTGIVFAILQPNMLSIHLFLIFLGLSYMYSATPFRFKSKPLVDSFSNVLYAVPGLIAYAQLTNSMPPFEFVFAAACWTAAMHLFSAIPDIEIDKAAGLNTTAVFLGKNYSLLLCSVLWLLSILPVVITPQLLPFSIVALIYPVMPFALLLDELLNKRDNKPVETIYWQFPYINMVNGTILWFTIVIGRFGIGF
jgi:4-hydroxybenzoate polyprenyltransferase